MPSNNGSSASLMRISEVLGKELPYNPDAEAAVLASVLVHPEIVSDVVGPLKAEYFFNDIYRGIFSAMVGLFTASRQIDIIAVEEECVARGVFNTREMARAHLKQLIESYISVANISSHVGIIRDKYYVRSLIAAAVGIIDNAGDGAVDAQMLLDSAEQAIYSIRQGQDTQGLVKIDTVIMEVYDRLQKLGDNDPQSKPAAKTGFSQLDKITTGLNDTDLIILAARPAMGKSAFALNIAVNACRATKKDTVIFSLEMSPEQVVSRMLASEALVNNTNLRTGQITREEWEKLAIGTERLEKLPIYLDPSAGMTVPAMKAKLRRMKNLGLVVIDYLQLMSSPNHHTNRVTEVSEITRQLKLMAKDLKVPVIALSQLSRNAEQRPDKRPMLSDLRESGSIEQDADIILFLYRDAYYDKENTADASTAECIVAKNRHGEVNTVHLTWRGEYTLFSDPDTIHKEN